jgi:copper oxidase (laccase) domain-containing protein
MDAPPAELIAFIGPGIGPRRYEVGEDVRRAFVGRDAGAEGAFVPGTEGKYFADLYALARASLSAAGVAAVFGGGYCTAGEDRFFSFRRDRTTGRMASLIWLEDD